MRLKQILTALLILTGCKTTAPIATTEKQDPIEGLVFLTFVMRTDSLSGKTINLIGKTIVQKRLKSNPENSSAPNRVWVNQLSGSGKKLASVALDHPLYRRVEFTNNKGEFLSHEMHLTNAEFFARVTLFTQTEYIQVEEELAGKITYTTQFKFRD